MEDQRWPPNHRYPEQHHAPPYLPHMGPQIQPARVFGPSLGSFNVAGQRQKAKKESWRLEFDWHIPFTSKKKKDCTSLPPMYQALQDPPPMYRPALHPPPIASPQMLHAQTGPVSWATQSAAPFSPLRPHSPAVVIVEPRTPERGRSRNGSPSREEAGPQVHFPTRVHERRRHGQGDHGGSRRRHSYSPGRRNHSRGRLERINERLARLERELAEWRRRARTAERLQNEMAGSRRPTRITERTETLLAEIRDYRERQAAERDAERRWQEQEEAHLQYARDQRRRRRQGTARVVEVHQTRHDNLEDRGAQVLGQAMQEELDRQAGRRARNRGLERRPEGIGLRRRGTYAGEQIVYDDDSRWAWRRRR
ncbi:hypothetical protein MMC34_007712 [Xylographa carneopallida]|nr:hypothetical protein [Xylographa carneopallida]